MTAKLLGEITALLPLLYMLPGLVAVIRRVPAAGTVFVMNLLFGWTIVGWLLALDQALDDYPSMRMP